MDTEFILRNRVKELRARLNLNQAEVAADAGVTRQTILAIEKGRLTPSVAVALKLARVLREPVDYVFYLDRVSELDRVGVNDHSVVHDRVAVTETPPVSVAAVAPIAPPAVVISPEPVPDPLAETTVDKGDIAGVEETHLHVSEPVETSEEVVQPADDTNTPRTTPEEPGAVFDFV